MFQRFYVVVTQCFYGFFALLIEFVPPLIRVLISFPFIQGADLSAKYHRVTERHDHKIQTYFKGKVCWITGASSGIGRSLSLLLARNGAFVILSSRSREGLERVAEQCQMERELLSGSDVQQQSSEPTQSKDDAFELVLPMNLENLESFPEIVSQAFHWKSRVDFLFNNGGISSRAPLSEFAIDQTINTVDFLAPTYLTKLCLGHSVKSVQEGLHIVNTSSIASKIFTCSRAAYGASKAALTIHSSILQLESHILLSNDHHALSVHVTNCLPGFINTNLLDRALLSKDAQLSEHTKSEFQNQGMSSIDCAEWILSATMGKLDEIWIGSRFELLAVYLSQYCPSLWHFVWFNLGISKRIYDSHKPDASYSIQSIASRLLSTT